MYQCSAQPKAFCLNPQCMLMSVCMFLCTYKRSTGVTTIKNKGWDVGERGVFWEKVVCLFYTTGITPGSHTGTMLR